ncbi:hypothetical protein MUP00_07545 [Candidatus Bathyarchaeota archaeon]|nr:hypothetical protein [Candidatus Bathyarchaeota archaeon]
MGAPVVANGMLYMTIGEEVRSWIESVAGGRLYAFGPPVNAAPEFPWGVILPLFILASATVTVLAMRMRKRLRQTTVKASASALS